MVLFSLVHTLFIYISTFASNDQIFAFPQKKKKEEESLNVLIVLIIGSEKHGPSEIGDKANREHNESTSYLLEKTKWSH